MINRDIAKILEQVADLMEINGDDAFRINAYRRSARAVDEFGEDVAEVYRRGELQKIPGVGKGTADRIREYLENGEVAIHQELLTELPAGVLDLLKIPTLGPKKVHLLYQRLGIASIDQLRTAIENGQVGALPSFGRKSVDKILEGIAFLERSAGRTVLGIALEMAEIVRKEVAAFSGVKRVEIAGSLRRGCETIGDIDLLCEATDGKQVIDRFTKLPQVTGVRAAGATKGSVLVPNPRGGELQIDLRVIPHESFGAAMQYFTGSQQHNVRLRELAVKKGWRLNEYGLFDGETPLAGEKEADIYTKLDLQFIPPELREDRGEIECKGDIPDFLEFGDLRGDLHMHSRASDGRNTLEELADAAKQRGYKYIAVTDHSRSSAIANGLSTERLLEHVQNIRLFNEKQNDVKLLAGVECDILSDGSLDYPDEVLAQLDWVNASIHAGMQQDREKVTGRVIDAMRNPYICAVSHPSGRLLGERDAMDLDWERVFQVAAETGTALEINASWQRLDLKDIHVKQAMEAGCWLVISTDAHALPQLDEIHYGITTARRGWATRRRVLNTRSLEELKQWVADKRK
jgi:DNA polymerase (family 10)